MYVLSWMGMGHSIIWNGTALVIGESCKAELFNKVEFKLSEDIHHR